MSLRRKTPDWATNCPEYKVTAVQVVPVSQPSDWQQRHADFSDRQEEALASAKRVETTAS